MSNNKQIEIRDINQNLQAILTPESDKVSEAWIDRQLNGPHTLEFKLPANSEKIYEITPESRILAGNREFIILRPEAIDVVREDNSLKIWYKVMSQESWKLLYKDYPTISNDPQQPPGTADLEVTIISGGTPFPGYVSGTAANALAYLLDGTDWELGVVDVEGTHDLETEKESTLANIEAVQKKWGGLLIWDYEFDSQGKVSRRILHLRDENKWQNYTGFQIRYAKNLKGITRVSDYDIVTRLYPFGENDLDIASVNNGMKYLVNHDFTPNVYMGIYRNQEISDPQELKDKGEEVLEKLSKPRYTYRVNMVDTTVLPEWSHEKYKVGDIVDVIDEPAVFNAQARLNRHKYNLFQKQRCEIEVGEPEERLEATLKDSFDSAKFIQEVTKPNTGFANLLKGALDTYATIVLGANGQFETVDGISTWKDGDTGQEVRISPGGILITQDGGQSWDTAITGLGIAGQYIIAGSIDAGSLNVEELSAISADLGTVTAGRIEVDVIFAGDLEAAGGTFTGTLQGVDGEFSGTITASDFIGGTINIGDGTFTVDSSGNVVANSLSATGASISGIINVTGGNAETQTGAQAKANTAENNASSYAGGLFSSLANSLGDLAWDDMVESAKLGTTIIQGGYIRTELLTADNIVTGTLSADRVFGGILSGVTINVDTVANIGDRLIINGNNWNALQINIGGTKKADLYYDPNTGALILNSFGGGGIYAGSQRIDQPPVAVWG